MGYGFKQILKQLIINNPDVDKEFVEKAYKFAKKKLKNRKHFLTGKSFIAQSLTIIETLLPLGIDDRTAATILLYYPIIYSKTSIEEIRREFGTEVAKMLAILKQYKEYEVNITNYSAEEKLLLAGCKDVRILLIKIVKSLSYLKNLKGPKERRILFAKGVLETRVPIIYKLGLYFLRKEFEDIIFKELEPEKYKKIKNSVAKLPIVKKLPMLKKQLETRLKEIGISAKIQYRKKHIYSIYQKMKRKNISIDKVNDIAGLRVITDTVEHCYEVLGIVHSIWKPVLEEFEDYIANPKPNGYRSVHTTLTTEDGMFEVQIRTNEMHLVAEYGVAAHWKYKGIKEHKDYEEILRRLSKAIGWSTILQPKSIEESIKDVDEPIIVFTPKRDVVVLPHGATVLDFAYAVHTELGNKCTAAKVNGKAVGIDYKLKNADTVEIITKKNQRPKYSWLSIVVTQKARQKIKSILAIKKRKKKDEKKVLEISKLKNVKVAKCCMPIPGDEVIAYRSKKRKLIVHRKNCINLEKLPKENLIEINWKTKGKAFLTELKVESEGYALPEVLKAITLNGNRLKGTHTKSIGDKYVSVFTLATENKEKLEDTINVLREIEGVHIVERA